MDLKNVKVGDRFVRDCDTGPYKRAAARVTEVSDTVVRCIVQCDVPRTFDFNRSDGICLDGRNFGWLDDIDDNDRTRDPDVDTF